MLPRQVGFILRLLNLDAGTGDIDTRDLMIAKLCPGRNTIKVLHSPQSGCRSRLSPLIDPPITKLRVLQLTSGLVISSDIIVGSSETSPVNYPRAEYPIHDRNPL